jgi:RNA polymerase sigma-70 factor (ECF subfamily)
MMTKLKNMNRWPALTAWLFTGLGLIALLGGLSVAPAAQSPPWIVSTSPAVGAMDVDPALKEITVTFDQDMVGGMSWTGGGPEFPSTQEGAQAQWRDKRTCVLPVKLQAGRYYRVGINSLSYRNFRSAAGVPAAPSAIYFTTQRASDDLKRKI